MRYILILLLLTVSFTSSYEAYLENGIGIKSISMGNAYYHRSDPESAYSNPALIIGAKNPQFQVVFNQKFENMQELFLSGVYPMDQFNLGITYFNSHLNNGVKGVYYDPNSISNVLTGETYSYYASLLMLSFAKEIDSKLAVGLNVKNFIKDFTVLKSSALAVDLGAKYLINPKLIASLKVSNILSTEYSWETENEKSQIAINAGLGFVLPGNINLNVGVKADPNNVSLIAGLEGSVDDALYYRGGYSKDVLSLGIGLQVDNMSFDYSYSQYLSSDDLLGAVHRFGMTYEFDVDAKKQRATIKQKSMVNRSEPVVNDVEAKHLMILGEDALDTQALMADIGVESVEKDITVNIAIMRVKLIAKKVIISGLAENAKSIWLGEQEIFIRPDNKFYKVGQYSKGGVPLTIIDADGQSTDIVLYRNGNKLVIKGKTELDKQPIYVDGNVVFKRSDGAFYKKIEFPKQVNFELKVLR